MPYDEKLAARIQTALGEQEGVVMKKMFGGVAFLINGNMACGVHKDTLIVRLHPSDYAEALGRPYARVFDLTGRTMKGWVTVDPPGFKDAETLQEWVDQSVAYAPSLPPK